MPTIDQFIKKYKRLILKNDMKALDKFIESFENDRVDDYVKAAFRDYYADAFENDDVDMIMFFINYGLTEQLPIQSYPILYDAMEYENVWFYVVNTSRRKYYDPKWLPYNGNIIDVINDYGPILDNDYPCNNIVHIINMGYSPLLFEDYDKTVMRKLYNMIYL